MTIRDWFLSLLDRHNPLKLNTEIMYLQAEACFKLLAVQSAINMIANTVARGEFLTYWQGKEVKGDNYYLFNVRPNQNKSASKFWRDVVSKLVYENECLVIPYNNQLYVADSYQVKEYAFYDNVYSGINIGELTLNRSYNESEVFHFELHNEKISAVLNWLYESYGKLITAGQAHYKKNYSKRGTLEMDTLYPQTDRAKTDLENLLNKDFKRFYETEGNAVLPLPRGMKYTELISSAAAKGSVEGRDIRAFIDDVFDFVAIGFQIPPQLLRGNVADTKGAMNNYLTLCAYPWAELLTDEINGKYYGKKRYLEKSFIKLDLTNIRAVDIVDVANALDVLERIGAYTVDDSLKYLGKEPEGTKATKTRWMTKNYTPIDEALKGDGSD
jgi:HK97 family phage portal protein